MCCHSLKIWTSLLLLKDGVVCKLKNYAVKVCMEHGDKIPYTLDFGMKLRWVVRFIPTHCIPGKEPLILIRNLGGILELIWIW